MRCCRPLIGKRVVTQESWTSCHVTDCMSSASYFTTTYLLHEIRCRKVCWFSILRCTSDSRLLRVPTTHLVVSSYLFRVRNLRPLDFKVESMKDLPTWMLRVEFVEKRNWYFTSPVLFGVTKTDHNSLLFLFLVDRVMVSIIHEPFTLKRRERKEIIENLHLYYDWYFVG